MRADLHIHSTNSDGLYTIDELIEMRFKYNIDIIAITDHDDLTNINYENIIHGIELSTRYNNEDIHLLGYFKDLDNLDEIKLYLQDRKIKRRERIKEICNRLDKYYDIKIDYNEILNNSNKTFGRPQIATLIAEKYNMTMNEAFSKYLNSDSKAFVPSSNLSTIDGIKMLHNAHAIAIIAHPVLYKNSIEELLKYADGAECIYPKNSENETKNFIKMTKNKIITAGSDFHGDTKHGLMGDSYLEGDYLNKFLSAINYKK